MMKRAALSSLLAALLYTAPLLGQASPPEGMNYVASSRGQVYYPVWCEAWHELATENLRWFPDEGTSERAGYRRTSNRRCAGERKAQPLGLVGVCTVEDVIDGDTVSCGEYGENIRLLLIDAPERDQGEFGPLATEALREILPLGTVVRLELDAQERDPYGRILAYLYSPEGLMINEEMARRGFVVPAVYPPNVRHLERIREAAAEARLAERGLWARDAFACAPVDYRAGRCN